MTLALTSNFSSILIELLFFSLALTIVTSSAIFAALRKLVKHTTLTTSQKAALLLMGGITIFALLHFPVELALVTILGILIGFLISREIPV